MKRSTNEATPDAVKDIKSLPKIMQVRNFGRAGQTKYTTLKDQDTSRPSGWTDPAMRSMQQRQKMAGFRGDDFKIASKLGGGIGGRGGFGGRGRGGDRGGFGSSFDKRDNSNNTQLGERRSDQGRSRCQDGDRDSGRDRDSSDKDRRGYDDRDADRSRRDSRDRGSSSSGRGRRDYDRDRDRDDRHGSGREYRDRDRDDDAESNKRRRL